MLLGPTMLPNSTLLRQCRTLPYPEVRIRHRRGRLDEADHDKSAGHKLPASITPIQTAPNSNLGDWDGTGTGLRRDWDGTGVRCDWVGMGTNAGICTGLALEQGDV